ncbi:hypothetical protein [Streptomyces sp. NPDC054757]
MDERDVDERDVDERDADERDADERDADREDEPGPPCTDAPPRTEALPERALSLPRAPPAIPVGGELTSPLGDTTGARPQVPQYSSPPPMSS